MSRDDNEDDDYEEYGGGNRLLGFMFGNVDNSGDLDVDYLDEDAKEHLAALADKLGPSLTDIDLIKSSPAPTDASEQDYDEKAEDAVDYEDIDEQYDGPEVQAGTEEDHLLPKKEFFSSNVSLASLDHKASVFDEENYDEDEETVKENEVDGNNVDVRICPSADEKLELISSVEISPDDNLPSVESSEPEQMIPELEDFQEHAIDEQKQMESKSGTSLPILCIEDGMAILRFSEIFGVHGPIKKSERKDQHRHSINKEWFKPLDVADIVEEDEEAFLRSSSQDLSAVKVFNSTIDDVEGNVEQEISGVDDQLRDSCLSAQPMKKDIIIDMFSGQRSPLCSNFYPLDQQDWEDAINWGNSPTASHGCSDSCMLSELDVEVPNDAEFEKRSQRRNVETYENDRNLLSDHILVEPFGSRNFSDSLCNQSAEKSYHPQLLRLESLTKNGGLHSEEVEAENGEAGVCKGDVLRRFIKLSLQNKELLEGSWLDQIIWDPDGAVPKPKLILDLQDDQMLFEVLDNKDGEHLCSHAGAMVITRSSKSSKEDSLDLHSQGSSASRFNISNDKYYSNRKSSQQAKSHAKKHAFLGIKVMHSVPALKLQTMKPKLSNKEIANFHRPKALWYPHDNKVAATIQGAHCTHGPMKIILMSMGGKGKGTKLTVNADETLSSFKRRASKKLDFKLSEKVKVYYSGRELEDNMSLAEQQVRPNSVLQLVRTRIHVWPRAQKLPGENKPLRPPGAFKKKSELSVKDGHVFLMEYCEERPLLLGNVGMGARLCTYYQKTAPSDQTASSLRNGNGLGTVLTLDPADRSPFLGDIGPGCSQSCLETNMYRAPIFSQKLSSTDYLLVRSAKGMLSLRRIDKLYVIGQQEPHMEVPSPGSKSVQTYLANRMLVHVYREFRANEKPDFLPHIRADELATLFPSLTDAFVRKRLKHCAVLKKGTNGQLIWGRRRDFRVPSEEELRRMLTPENVCSYESMQAGLYRLKRLGISRLTQNIGLSSAINQLPYEAISLAAASHIERELQITPWNLTSNFVACTNQGRENIERLEITGVGDPSGRGLGFSYVRVTPKAPISNAVVKKKAAAARGGPTVTGTDADLRRLSMDAAREVLLKFNVPEEKIGKLTRWHRIAMVRKLSSEQAASGVKVDAMTLSKFARGQRMSFLQLQQQTREKCQEIWDRQVQSLSAADVDENDSDSEANSDLDSFAGDLENLLDAEECEEDDGNTDLRGDKADGVRGLKMRRCPSQAQTEEEIEDDEAEAVIIRRLLEDDGADIKKKTTKLSGVEVGHGSHLDTANGEFTKKINTVVGQILSTPNPDGSFPSKELMTRESKEVENSFAERSLSGKVKPKKGNGVNDDITGSVNKKSASVKDGLKVFKEKKQTDKPVRENFVCGACGQLGHMRTNKNCPKYGEDAETSELESVSGKSNLPDAATQLHVKTPGKKLVPKMPAKAAEAEVPESVEKAGLKLQTKILPVKFKCGPTEKPSEKKLSGIQTSDKQIVDAEGVNKPTGKINKIIISNKMKSGDVQNEIQKSSVLIRLPVDTEKEQSRKKIIIKQPKVNTNVEQVNSATDTGIDHDFRKIKKITELSSFEKQKNQEGQRFAEETSKRNLMSDRRLWDEEEKRKGKERIVEEKTSRMLQEERRMQEEHHRLFDARRYQEAFKREEKAKKKKKKKKHDFRDEYLLDHRPYRNDRRIPERDRAAKRRLMADADQTECAPLTKRRRGGEVELSNILETILDSLKENIEISYLFLKPVTKKEAPDYLDIIKRPMDLSTIRDKVRNMEYKSREDFRHDVWQIAYNAHKYNDGRNPGIPPLADQLLELCDYHLEQKHHMLSDAEAGIEFRDM